MPSNIKLPKRLDYRSTLISQLTVLVVGMAKVMSEKQVSVPRIKLLGNQMGFRFAAKEKKS